MRQKLPAIVIFQLIGKKPIALLSNIAKRSGWDQPLRGRRFYKASAMVRAVLLYRIKDMGSLDELVCHLSANRGDRKRCGFEEFTPSRSTFSRFLSYIGHRPFEELFYQLLDVLKAQGKVRGRHLAIDSTFVKARSKRKSKDKNSPDYKIARNCDFARLGMSPEGYQVGYRIHVATLTKSGIPVVVKVFPGNVNDRKAFEIVLRRSLRQIPAPLAVSADKGYSSGKNRQLVQAVGAACVIRPSKSDLKGTTMKKFIPEGMSEKTYWVVYWRRNAVERTFGQAKGYCGLDRPRIVDKDPVKQHVFLSFVVHLLLIMASDSLGLSKTSFSIFV